MIGSVVCLVMGIITGVIALFLIICGIAFKDEDFPFMQILILVTLSFANIFLSTQTAAKDGDSHIIEPIRVIRDDNKTIVVFMDQHDEAQSITDTSVKTYMTSNVTVKAIQQLSMFGKPVSWEYKVNEGEEK